MLLFRRCSFEDGELTSPEENGGKEVLKCRELKTRLPTLQFANLNTRGKWRKQSLIRC